MTKRYRFRVEIGGVDATGVPVWTREYFVETDAGNAEAARDQMDDLFGPRGMLLDISLAAEHEEGERG